MGFSTALRACRSLFRIKLAEAFAYRISALTNTAIGLFWAILECVMYTVFFSYGAAGAAAGGGLTLSQTISYVWLAQSFGFLAIGSVNGEILSKINDGNVGIELCRPLDLYFHWFTKTAADKLGLGWIRCVCILTIGALMPAGFSLKGPASAAGFFVFCISVIMAFFLSAAYAMFITAVRMNVTWGNGPVNLILVTSMLLSGVQLPLRLWPDFMQGFLRLQPFAGVIDTPMQLFIGSLAPAGALRAIAVQAVWLAAFVAAGRVIMRKRLKTIIIQGG